MEDVFSTGKATEMVNFIKDKVGFGNESSLKTKLLPFDLKKAVR